MAAPDTAASGKAANNSDVELFDIGREAPQADMGGKVLLHEPGILVQEQDVTAPNLHMGSRDPRGIAAEEAGRGDGAPPSVESPAAYQGLRIQVVAEAAETIQLPSGQIAIRLNLDDVLDKAGFEAVTFTNLPAGVSVAGGTAATGEEVTVVEGRARIEIVLAPGQSPGPITLVAVAVDPDDGTPLPAETTESDAVVVEPETEVDSAAAPNLELAATAGTEDRAIPLDIEVTTTDGDSVSQVVISGVPDGAVLSAGTDNDDGTWTLSASDLNGLTIAPPADFSGSFALTVTATAVDGSASATSTDTFEVTVAADADAPLLTAIDATGNEDTAIALDLAAALTDTDGSERLAITISGIPDGAVLSAGSDNGDGTWTLTADQLEGLTVTPSADFNGSFELTVTATSTDGGDTADTTTVLTVEVAPVADAPVLEVAAAAGTEDSPIALNLAAAVPGAEDVASVAIGGVPEGAVLSAGTDNGDGTWTLSTDDLEGLTLTPPADYNGGFDLTVTATSTDGGVSTASLSVEVENANDGPTTSAVDLGAGTEDSPVTFSKADLLANAADVDGDALSAANISADHGTITDNGDGTVTFTPDANYNGEVTFTYTVSDGNGGTASGTATMDLAGVADTPTLSVDAAIASQGQTGQGQTLTGTNHGDTLRGGLDGDIIQGEGGNDTIYGDVGTPGATVIALNVSSTLGDLYGSETLSVTISGLPDGATLSAGTDNGDGSWTLAADQLTGLTVTTPEGHATDFTLQVTATATEVGGDSATTTSPLQVSFSGIGGDDTIIGGTGDDYLYGNGGDDTFVYREGDGTDRFHGGEGADTVDATAAQTVYTSHHGGEATVETIVGNGATVISGTSGGNTLDFTNTKLEGIAAIDGGAGADSIKGSADADTIIGGTGDDYLYGNGGDDTFVYREGDGTDRFHGGEGADTVDATAAQTVYTSHHGGEATVETIVGNGATVISGTSGGNTLDFTNTKLEGIAAIDGGAGADSIKGSADADTIIGGTGDDYLYGNGGDDTVVFSGNWNEYTIVQNADGSFTIGDTVPGRDGTDRVFQTEFFKFADGATTAATIFEGPDHTAATPDLNASAASGTEDAAIALDITAALTDTDGSEALSIVISGVPEGASLSAGTDNGDGTWTLTADQLDGLTVTPPANYSGSFDLTVTATTTESNGGDTASVSQSLEVQVAGVADAPTLVAGTASGIEDHVIALDITAALTDTDGSEALSVVISGVPEGASLSAGIDNGDGIWTLTADQLDGLTVTPPADYSGSFDLTVTATSIDGADSAQTVATLNVAVAGDADAPVVAAPAASAAYDHDVALDITAAVSDVSESIASITIADVPEGAILSAGTDNEDGTWTLSADDLDGLTITPPPGYWGTFDLTVTVESQDGADTAATTVTLPVTIADPSLFGDGSADDDTLAGSDGNDSLDGGIGNDLLQGGAGDDTLDGSAGDDTLQGGSGNDLLRGGDGIDTADFGDSAGSISVSLSSKKATGDGTDTLDSIENVRGSGFGDTITGNSGVNLLEGGAGDDTINAGSGNDTLSGGAGNDILKGASGTDTVTYANAEGPVNIDLAGKIATGEGIDALDSIENAIGSAFDDVMIGSSGNNVLKGGAGNDVIDGGAGSDSLHGGLGNDILQGGAGTDSVFYSEAAGSVTVNLATQTASGASGFDTLDSIENAYGSNYADTLIGSSGNNLLSGGGGNDVIDAGGGNDKLYGGAGDDLLNGGSGTDSAYYSNATQGVTVDLAAGTATGEGSDTLVSIENVYGSGLADVLTGTSGANRLDGGAGNDILDAGGGNDNLVGGAGDDTLIGGAGTDTAIYNSSAGVTVDLAAGTASGGDGNDILSGIERVTSGKGADILIGDDNNNVLSSGAGNDVLYGGGGNDTLSGSTGDDSLFGGLGNDILSGGNGNDVMVGDAGDDTLSGGAGDDLFVFGSGAGHDVVHGGGEGWLDTLQLQNGDGSAPATGEWTLELTSGSIEGQADHYVQLSEDASGSITFQDGSKLDFDGIERIQW
jgi:Ca2+-binding RTX toxin-like protein